MCASTVIFSRVSREVWMIGDCQCLLTPLVNGERQAPAFYDNPKPYEQQLAEERAAYYHSTPHTPLGSAALQSKEPSTDEGRALIIPHMKEAMLRQNIDYAVIDGFPIPQQHVRKLTLDFRPWEIVLASDGYPFLCPTLQESEERLARQLSTDPMNILGFKATKGLQPGNLSFDDRAYIRFVV
jgi:glycerophosphoryl diester phosphodiesterase